MSEAGEELAGLRPGQFLWPRVPGVNVDRVDVAAGMAMLARLGWTPETDPHTWMVVEHALLRHKRGEEEAAERGAIDASFYGIDFTSWRVVLAAAVASGETQR